MESTNRSTPEYDSLLDLVTNKRQSMRKLKPDPIPDEYITKILEVARWAMSGANSQPWEFVVVKNEETKKKLFDAYVESSLEFCYWMEQMRIREYRHPAFIVDGDLEEQWQIIKEGAAVGWNEAPVVIVALADGRRQWGTVMGGHTFGRHQSHLTDGMSQACLLAHMAANALGLGTQWVTPNGPQDAYKRILNIPDILDVYLIIPVGWPAFERSPGVRRPLEDIVHYETYDWSKYMEHKDILDYIRSLRTKTLYRYPNKGEDPRTKGVQPD